MKKSFWERYDLVPTLFLTLTPISAFSLSTIYWYYYGWSWSLAILFVLFYAATAMSITAGYHRLFAHCTYEARPLLKIYYALMGAAAFQQSILKWSTDHRLHHRFVDGQDDPYSINKGFWFAHIGWMLEKQKIHPMANALSRDLQADKIVMWQYRNYVLLAILMGIVLPALLGWWLSGSLLGGLAIPALLRIVALHHGTFLINSWCHYFGRQPYTDENTARDSWLMAFATFGEGFHNFHHKWASDYRNGVKWYEWDPTKWLIALQRFFGVAQNLKRTPETEILAAKLDMVAKRLKQSRAAWPEMHQKLDQLKERVRVSQENWRRLKDNYLEVGRTYKKHHYDRFLQMRREMRQARYEFTVAMQQWQEYVSSMQRLAAGY